MDVSSVTSTHTQQAALASNRAESRVEGSQPDGDGDQDDVVATAQQDASGPVGPLGSQLNVTA